MSKIDKLVIASNNQAKIAELQHLFSPLNITIIPQSQFNLLECDEPYSTFIENALRKARYSTSHTKLPTIADDSGLCIKALGGKPGVLSARYSTNNKSTPRNASNIAKVLEELSTIKDRSAYFYCSLVLIRNLEDPQPLIAEGYLHGEIISAPKGTQGFGYDSIFKPHNFNVTLAQMNSTEKNKISHRAKAIEHLQSLIKTLGFY